jgi:hypothetical protein
LNKLNAVNYLKQNQIVPFNSFKMSFTQVSEFDLEFEIDGEILLSPAEWSYNEEGEEEEEEENQENDLNLWADIDFLCNVALNSEENELVDLMSARVIPENGQNHEDWIQFLQHFQSAIVYSKRVDHFILTLDRVMTTEELGIELIKYFNYQHELK